MNTYYNEWTENGGRNTPVNFSTVKWKKYMVVSRNTGDQGNIIKNEIIEHQERGQGKMTPDAWKWQSSPEDGINGTFSFNFQQQIHLKNGYSMCGRRVPVEYSQRILLPNMFTGVCSSSDIQNHSRVLTSELRNIHPYFPLRLTRNKVCYPRKLNENSCYQFCYGNSLRQVNGAMNEAAKEERSKEEKARNW